MNKLISVVIPCRNEKAHIQECLDSIIASEYSLEKIEVFVCDAKSNDGTMQIVHEYEKKYKNIFYVLNNRQTTPHALNLGIKKSHGEIIIIIGAHSAIDKKYISECIKLLDAEKELGCVGGILENVFEDENSKCIALAMSSPFGVGNAHFRTGTKDGYVDTVAFGAYKKEVFDKVGLFDEELTRNQDDEFNFRVIKSDYKIKLSKNIKTKYYVRSSFQKLFSQYFQYGYWKVIVNKKHKTITTLRQIVPLVFALFTLFGIFGSILFSSLFIYYITMMILYFLLSLFFALKKNIFLKLTIKIMLSFWILHFAYGFGYIKAIFTPYK